ncbi:hypothetical protein Tco_0847312, partial [Tanacetum coccineum]
SQIEGFKLRKVVGCEVLGALLITDLDIEFLEYSLVLCSSFCWRSVWAEKASMSLKLRMAFTFVGYGNLEIALIFCLIDLDSRSRDLMTEDDSLLHHEVAFLPVQYEAGLLTPLQHLFYVLEAVIEGATEDREIIHKYFHSILD